MSDTRYCVFDTSNGNDVAKVLAGLYLNSYSLKHPRFMELMLKENTEIKHNFTVLCLEWFKILAQVSYYDDRNVDSVIMSREISKEIINGELRYKPLRILDALKQMTINYRDDKEMEQLLVAYLVMSIGHMSFLRHMLDEHKTLQQNFSRFCLEWFNAVLENEDSNSSYFLLAKKANEHSIPLRYI